MHEFAMAQGIFNTVMDTAEANDAIEVTEIVVEIGRLAMLNPEQLKFMLGVMCEGEELTKNVEMIINNIDVEIKCYNCGFEGAGNVDDSDHYAPMVLCAECESHRVQVINGKDITVRSISIEKEDD